MPTVLVIDPDQTVLSVFRSAFTAAGFEFLGARRGDQALIRVRTGRPAAIVSRIDLPDCAGLEILEAVRPVPVFLTGVAGQEDDLAAGLEAGASDVDVYPLDPEALVGRVQKLLAWRARNGEPKTITAGPITLDLATRTLVRPNATLTPHEFHILRWLIDPPGKALSRRQIADVTQERTVDAHVASLRRKLGAASACIATLRGIGYRFAL